MNVYELQSNQKCNTVSHCSTAYLTSPAWSTPRMVAVEGRIKLPNYWCLFDDVYYGYPLSSRTPAWGGEGVGQVGNSTHSILVEQELEAKQVTHGA